MSAPWPKQEDDFLFLPRFQLELGQQGGTGIEGRPGPAGQLHAAQGRRCLGAAVATQELGPVACHCPRPEVHIGKGDPRRKILVKGAASQQGAAFRVHFGNNIHRRLVAHRAQHPLRKERGTEAAGLLSVVADLQPHDLNRVGRRHENGQFLGQPIVQLLEDRVALAVTNRCHRRRREPVEGSATRWRRSPRRAGRWLRRADRRRCRCSTASDDWSGYCRPRCSPDRFHAPGSRRPVWRSR